MRPYRGLTKDSEWVYGDRITLYHPVKRTCIANKGNNQDWCNTKFIEVLPESVSQSTGLKDKNGPVDVEVFEGDLIGFWFGHYDGKKLIAGRGLDPKSICVVEMKNGCWMAGDKLLIKQLETHHLCGTIHENPELLEREEENANQTE